MNFVTTKGGIHLILNGKPLNMHKSDPQYEAVVAAIQRNAAEAEIVEIIEAELRKMQSAVEVVPGIDIKGGQLYHKGEVIHGVLGEQMLQMREEGFDLTAMGVFLDNLQLNPSMRVVENLYGFLQYGKSPITEDGCFLAYKAVRADFKDIHSGSFDNSVGQVLQMARNKVDENSNNTCSHGFHVCSFDYLKHFASANGHVVVCKVNPADVVAIPADYNNTKMRVCKYEVVSEYEGYYTAPEDTLAGAAVTENGMGRPFEVESSYGKFDDFAYASSHFRLSEAALALEELLESSDVYSVRIINKLTGNVVDKQDNDNFDDDANGDDFDCNAQEEEFFLFRVQNGGTTLVEGGFESVSDAVNLALDQDDGATYEIRDENNTLVRTIT